MYLYILISNELLKTLIASGLQKYFGSQNVNGIDFYNSQSFNTCQNISCVCVKYTVSDIIIRIFYYFYNRIKYDFLILIMCAG